MGKVNEFITHNEMVIINIIRIIIVMIVVMEVFD